MKRFVFEVKALILQQLRIFLSLLAGGNSCRVCGSYTILIPLCKSCQVRYFSLAKDWNKSRCCICGKELLSLHNKCMKCRTESVFLYLDRLFPLYSYRLWNKTLLFDWKIRGMRCLSAFFAEKVSCFLRNMEIKVIVPVPARKGKIRKKGWDQIDELTSFLKWHYGFKVLSILQRLSLQEQKKLSRQERFAKTKNAYALVSSKKMQRVLKPFLGKIPEEVCLIDDVSTTGATLESCAQVLKSAGIKKVVGVTLFTVD